MSKQSLFQLTDYRDYVKSWTEARGRGEYGKIARHLGVHTTLVSQVFNGRKTLTEEQASKLCVYMSLSDLETDYFLKLVQIERAGTDQLQAVYRRHLDQIKDEANKIKSRVPTSTKMTEQDRALFYSSWQYSLVRLMTSIPKFQSKEKIAFALGLSVSRVQEILDFLVSRSLCKEERGRYIRTTENTHVDANSPLAIRHHQNWRNKVIVLQEMMTQEDLCFTAPISIANKDKSKVRKILLDTISEISKIVEPSTSEEVIYLGIDWIKIIS